MFQPSGSSRQRTLLGVCVRSSIKAEYTRPIGSGVDKSARAQEARLWLALLPTNGSWI